MPPPIGPYDQANPSGAQLTQSRDDARQQANRARGYDPDALQRTLDWIGRQLGSGNRAGPTAGSRVVDWIGRQFESDPWAIGGSKNPRVTDPYDRKNPAVNAWFTSQANSPTPFGNVQYGPPNKPVTKISSAPKIQKKVVSTLAPPPSVIDSVSSPGFTQGVPDPPMIDSISDPNFIGGPPGPGPAPYQPYGPDNRSLWAGVGEQPPPPMVDFSAGPMPPDVNFGSLPPRNATWWDNVNVGSIPRDRLRQTPKEQPKATAGWNPFGGAGSWFGKAEGGPIGLMRGGYPELYGSERMPVRHTFDSGGENFVGNAYSGGSGRADDVNAKLSAKEYVMDAESMALLGDGNPDHGAKKMDQMRANLRKEKGAALAKGKFSPKAKSAQEYLAGNPMGDGLRRRGKDKG